MHLVYSGMSRVASRPIRFYDPPKSRPLRPISSRRERSTPITEFMSARGASSTTQVSPTAGGADRWKKFLSSVSLTATASGFDRTGSASTLALWWSGRARASASAAIAF